MLGRIIKYEWKGTARILLPIQAIVLILSLLARFQIQPVISTSYRYYSASSRIFGAVSNTIIFAYIVVLIIANAFTFIYLFQNYYRTMFKDAGYLTHTLPVKTPTILHGKFIMNFIWILISIVVAMLSMLIAFWSGDFFGFMGEVVNAVVRESQSWNHSFVWYIIMTLLLVLGCIASTILEFYLCMSVGQLAQKHHLLAGVGTFFAIYIIQKIVANIFLGLQGGIGVLLFESSLDELIDKIYVWGLIEYMIIIVVCYILTRLITTNKLNLE